ncbi:MAG TPA: dihydropteroate synthase [Candidatus Binataceae bacterium]|nr:dihydropteroate synthase [Candidatus Binataceae bacterium]
MTPRRPARSARRTPRALRLRDGRTIRFPAVMGVLNVTPDSFSDGGLYLDPDRALEHALAMEAEGAGIIDVGGESTRPAGARAVSAEVEIARVQPVLERLGRRLRVPFSIDTRRAAVARIALDAGAAIINDVSALGFDAAMLPMAAAAGCAVVLMHMRGGPADHARHARYRDVVAQVCEFLRARADAAIAAGIRPTRIIVDPGFGFAKTARHNLELMGGLSGICALGYPVLVGASRKRFVRTIAGGGATEVAYGTAAVNTLALAGGASIIRVHEAAPAAAVIRMVVAIVARGGP